MIMAIQDRKKPDTDSEENWLSLEEAGAIIGVSARRVRKICEAEEKRGTYRLGTKVVVRGTVTLWKITREQAEAYALLDRPVGRPRKIA
jgi:hypothetical protein